MKYINILFILLISCSLDKNLNEPVSQNILKKAARIRNLINRHNRIDIDRFEAIRFDDELDDHESNINNNALNNNQLHVNNDELNNEKSKNVNSPSAIKNISPHQNHEISFNTFFKSSGSSYNLSPYVIKSTSAINNAKKNTNMSEKLHKTAWGSTIHPGLFTLYAKDINRTEKKMRYVKQEVSIPPFKINYENLIDEKLDILHETHDEIVLDDKNLNLIILLSLTEDNKMIYYSDTYTDDDDKNNKISEIKKIELSSVSEDNKYTFTNIYRKSTK